MSSEKPNPRVSNVIPRPATVIDKTSGPDEQKDAWNQLSPAAKWYVDQIVIHSASQYSPISRDHVLLSRDNVLELCGSDSMNMGARIKIQSIKTGLYAAVGNPEQFCKEWISVPKPIKDEISSRLGEEFLTTSMVLDLVQNQPGTIEEIFGKFCRVPIIGRDLSASRINR